MTDGGSARRLLGGLALLLLLACGAAQAKPSRVERLDEQVTLVRDDSGQWTAHGSKDITHQVHAPYQAKKRLDLSRVPEALWNAATEARLSVFFCVRDYSEHTKGESNGLDEAFEIVVNGSRHRVPTNSGVPVWADGKPLATFFRWHDFAVPKAELVRGPNEIILRKVTPEGKDPDDYLYLGIDTTVEGGNSFVKFGPDQSWRHDKLTVPGGAGEYMVRVYLLAGDTAFEATWRPGGDTNDRLGIFAYAGSHGPTTRLEWNPRRIDPLSPLAVVVRLAEKREFTLRWLDAMGKPVKPAVTARSGAALQPPESLRTSGIELAKDLPIEAVTLRASRNYHPLPRRIDMAPHIAEPKGAPADRRPSCTIQDDTIRLDGAALRAVFRTDGGRLRLASLYNELAAAEMARRPDDCALFLVEVDGARYAGSRHFACQKIAADENGTAFTATLFCDAIKLEATLRCWMDRGLRMSLSVTNRGAEPLDFKTAFPHLAGLAVSDEPADDYYFFPWGGGIIADAPATIRRGYGDHAALYQVMDIFSPRRGAGLAIRCLDADGRYKVLALRKHIPGQAEMNGDKADTPTAEEFKWTNSLPAVPGTGLAFEYLRRTRKPGEAFQPKPVLVEAHPGDWHAAMARYANWCHDVWDFRPWPNRLTPIINMVAVGWGQSPLYAYPHQTRLSEDLGYRADFIQPRWDCIELMSWWEWSPLGPWQTPWDELKERLGEAKYNRYKSYYVKDPVTGKTMYPINRGDYDGYNQRWGGLPALRKAIKAYQDAGQLVTLYTDPILADDNTALAREHGKEWCIVKPDGSFRTNYESWNMCHDVAAYRRYVAETMRRVMRETGADGIRLDEYGHKGAACFSTRHEHTFAEHGTTEWQRCIAETTKMVRQAMDQVAPRSVLTTEHPGYDFLMPFIEGCITYDLTGQATPLRPVECNLQRFYFPECKPFELDHRRADPDHVKRFWNAVGAFGHPYPKAMYAILKTHADAFNSRDCTPLVPTLARFVYANRFRTEGKTLYTLYNATGHTFAGPVLRVPLGKDQQVTDLLGGAQLSVKRHDATATVSLYLPRDSAACLLVAAEDGAP
jgi:hypothetical protein